MAAGDILLTIKAKYDSVDAAYVAVKGIQDAITGINKTKIDIKGIQSVTTSSKNLAKELGVVQKRFTQFSGKNPWGFRTLSNNLRTLNEQLAGAAFQLGNNAKAANRKNAALTLVAGAYKKARIQLIGYSKVQKELWRRSEIERKKFKGKEPAAFAFQDYGPVKPTVRKPVDYGVPEPIRIESRKYDEVRPYQEFLASLKAEGGEFDKRIKSGRDGLRGDAELRKRWNSTERAEWKAEEKLFQQEERKIYNEWAAGQKKFLAEQKANIAADEKNLQAWTSAKQKHESAEVAREKEVLAAKKKYDEERRLFDIREDERIAKKRGKSDLADTKYLGNVEAMASRMQAIAGKPASLGQVEHALQQIAPLIDWAVEDTEEWNLLTKTQNQLMEKRVALQEKLKGAQVSTKRSALASERGILRPGVPKEIGVPSYDKADAVEKAQMFKMASDLQKFQTIKDPKALGQILADVATRPIDKIVKELKVDFDQLGGAADEATSAIDKLRKGVGKTTRPKSDYVRDGKWGFYGSPTDDQISRNKLYDPINWGPEGELYKWRAEKRSTMFTPEARASRRQGARQRLGRKNLGNMLGGKNAQNFLLGGGFPMLFGGGAGAVGGSLLGSGIAKGLNIPGGGFGLQIAGSAIGTMLETAISKTRQLSVALNELNMDSLMGQGIRFSAEMQYMIRTAKDQGQHGRAAGMIEQSVFEQTGGTRDVFKDVENSVGILSAGWDDFRNSVSLTVSIIAAPLMVALGAVLKAVALIAEAFNVVASAVRETLGEWYERFVPDEIKDSWEQFLEKFDQGLQKAKISAMELIDSLKTAVHQSHEMYDKLMGVEKTVVGTRGGGTESLLYRLNPRGAMDRFNNMRIQQQWDKERFVGSPAQFGDPSKGQDYLIKGATGLYAEFNKAKPEMARLMVEDPKTYMKSFDEWKERKMYIYDKGRGQGGFEHQKKIEAERWKLEQLYGKNLKGDGNTIVGMEGSIYRRNQDLNASEIGRKKIFDAADRGIPLGQQEIAKIGLQDQFNAAQSKRDNLLQKYNEKEMERKRTAEEILEIRTAEIEVDKAANKLLLHKTDIQLEIKALWQDIGMSIKSGIVEGIEAAIDGTKTLGEVAGNVFKSIGRMLLQYGVNTGMASLMPNNKQWQNMFGNRAAGGPVTGGRPYIVGEEGPELFVPGASGGIVPNGALGGGVNVNVNVDANGTSVQGDADQSRQLGNLVGAAVQSEILRQQRPGGLLH